MINHNQISSFFVSPYFIGGSLVLSFICAYYDLVQLSGYIFFVFLLSAIAFIWSYLAVGRIAVQMVGESLRAYPGQCIEIQYVIQNMKWMPLIWLEWWQPYPRNHCFTPPSDFHIQIFPPELDEPAKDPILRKGFSFIKPYGVVKWSSTFQASRRGVYIPSKVGIYTGDGFGLSVRTKEFNLTSPPIFVVYPARVPVSTQIFFRSTWSATTGPQGNIEDVTVLRSIRDYGVNDPFKRINWRMAARGEDLCVNVYDTISPRATTFFIDTASFFEVSEKNEAFEETLSVVGSLIAELFESEMSVGLYLTNSASANALSVDPEDTSLAECLFALALCDCSDGTAQFSGSAMAHLISAQSGNIYYVCYDGCHSRFHLLSEQVGQARLTMICHQYSDENGVDTLPNGTHFISQFRRG